MLCIASDHAGFRLKNKILSHLKKKGVEIEDLGTFSEESCDYPLYGRLAAEAVARNEYEMGLLVCGTGAGIAMAAGKVNGIRCACCSDTATARLARQHNNANMLAIGERIVGMELAFDIVDAFISTSFSQDERHIRRAGLIEPNV